MSYFTELDAILAERLPPGQDRPRWAAWVRRIAEQAYGADATEARVCEIARALDWPAILTVHRGGPP